MNAVALLGLGTLLIHQLPPSHPMPNALWWPTPAAGAPALPPLPPMVPVMPPPVQAAPILPPPPPNAGSLIVPVSAPAYQASPAMLPATPVSLPSVAPPVYTPYAQFQRVAVPPEAPACLGTDCHSQECCAPCDHHGCFAGASIYMLRPYFHDNTAFVIRTDIAGNAPAAESPEFEWPLQLGVAAWLGWSGPEGYGIRSRYFWYDQASDPISVVNNNAGTRINQAPGLPDPQTVGSPRFQSPFLPFPNQLSFLADIQVYSIDLELTKDFALGSWWLVGSAGGRYQNLAMNYRGINVNGAGLAETVLFDQEFAGAGPTVGLQVRRLLGERLGLYGSMRGTLLVGNENWIFESSQPSGAIALQDIGRFSQTTLRSVAELELGIEYRQLLGAEELFLQVAVVDHTYFDAGSPSNLDGDLSLFGFQASLGWNR